MKAQRTFLLLLLLIVGVGTFIFLWLKLKPTLNSRLREEQEVYSEVLAEYAYQAEEYTTLGLLSVNSEDKSDFSSLNLTCTFRLAFTQTCAVESFAEAAPNVSRRTVLDFLENNRQSYLLKNYVSAENSNMLLSYDDLQGLPNGSGWISVSRIGFNSTFTEALVLLSQNAKFNGDVFVCNEFYEILQKVDDMWILQNEVKIVDCELPPLNN